MAIHQTFHAVKLAISVGQAYDDQNNPIDVCK